MIDVFHTAGQLGTAALRLLPPEMAHNLGINLLRHGLLSFLPKPIMVNHGIQMACDLPGVGALPHPIGLAAGFDKNAKAMLGFEKMGFSFLELGTVTPKPQPGNQTPRMFRDAGQRSIVNRMGFNSDGADVIAKRIKDSQWTNYNIPIGINLGKNKETAANAALKDYVDGLEAFANLARYFVINISSPNTPGLRDLASPNFINTLAFKTRSIASRIWIKLDPDMPRKTFQDLIMSIKEAGFQGVILSNTHRVEYPEPGGLSGHPLLTLANTALERAWEVHRGTLSIIASGGILSGADVFQKIARGATAVQIYTALVYRGPGAVSRIYEELAIELKLRNIPSVREALGCYYKE
ncbi:MAG: quinone-dependent dihydroorotate dehydrogenase [Proteobacteria bacterium]|nr:quinone-dependent dihydroorotate dehydrogenase [Pseudomonadota bacterium]